jgi:hypothetical protein
MIGVAVQLKEQQLPEASTASTAMAAAVEAEPQQCRGCDHNRQSKDAKLPRSTYLTAALRAIKCVWSSPSVKTVVCPSSALNTLQKQTANGVLKYFNKTLYWLDV